jgi:hypothetical protein
MSKRQGMYQHELEQLEQKTYLDQPLTVGCSLCPEWSASGTAEEVIAEQRAHREAHGIKPYRRLKPDRRGLRTIRQQELNEEERAEVNAEIARRWRLIHGSGAPDA